MTAVLDELPFGANVAVIRLRSLGDCVLSTPALALLKAARPDLRIAVVVDPQWSAIYQANSDVTSIIPPLVGALRAFRPELVLNLHGGTTSARLTALSGARWRAGFAHYRFQPMYNIRLPRAQSVLRVERAVHTAEHAASAIFALGVSPGEIPRARVFAERPNLEAPYALIHPVASESAKTWNAAGFLEVARFLHGQIGLEPIFLGGPSDDLSAFRGYRIAQGQTLEETKSLVAGASCFLGNDSGPAHLAAAFGLPVTVLFGPSNPSIWGPWKTQSTVLHADRIDSIAAAQTIEAVSALLSIGAPQ
jgi:heptosyltransferase-3